MTNKIEQLYTQVNDTLCSKYGDNTFVFGKGNCSNPLLMLIGEAPGKQEVQQKEPFVGKAGKNLNEFLKIIDVDRKNLYITNVVKIRPYKIGKSGKPSNRPPNKEEITDFLPYLFKEIEIVKPKTIVTLGNTPLKALLNDKATIGDFHGKPTNHKIDDLDNLSIFPLYHPASIIYNRSLKDTYFKDLQLLKEYLEK